MNQNKKTTRFLMWNISSGAADVLFSLSNLFLVVGAAAVLIGTIGSIKMASVREYFADLRLSDNERETSKANLRAAGLEKQAAESKERAIKLELELAKIKQPRLIAEDKLKSISEKLKPFASTPFDLAFISGDPEAAIFGTHIAAVLEMAGWEWVAWAPPGASFQQVFTITGTTKPNIGQFGFFDVVIFLRPGDPQSLVAPTDALVESLREEGFAVTFEVLENPNTNNKATVHIAVGKKR